MKKLVIMALVLTIFIGCAKKEVTKTDETQEQIVKETIDTTKEDVTEQEEGITPLESEMITEEEMEVAKIEPTELSLQEEKAERENVLKNIHFDYDKYFIREDDKLILNKTADWLIMSEKTTLLIEGHCDDRGTSEYNLALGDRRAKAAKDYLISLGVSSDRLKIISFGEEKPLCEEQNDKCWQTNRRAQFMAFDEEVK